MGDRLAITGAASMNTDTDGAYRELDNVRSTATGQSIVQVSVSG